MTGRAFVFAGGGTGGHLYPGVAVARALEARSPGVRTLFLCSDRPLDAKILTDEGVTHRVIAAQPFALSPRRFARFARAWGGSVRASRDAIREVRRGGATEITLLAMGGFVAAPGAQAARAEGAGLVLVNLDAVPGKANRLIARRADRVFTSTGDRDAPGNVCPASWSRIPPIVRADAVPSGTAPECRARLGLDPDTPTLFVTGASQGARSINGAFATLLASNPGLFRGWQVYHQTGEGADEQMRDAYERAGVRAVVVPFVRTIGDAWGASDLAIARSGAGTVAEAWASSTPCVFLPYPYHRDQHQKANASPLVACGGAILQEDRIDPDANALALTPTLERVMGDESLRTHMRDAIRTLGPADGADRVAAALLGG